ncbi:hypothetical protein EYB53_019650 [Candidatus Chloroploca sp. M-50]|uniref:Uncharacterized protein n=1 Tax=Candidatus Chloroploca mongolica TaxID=2528176 RepID=A0ABS4DET1_9CHLR|nr:hypothetical protein [Candidatus Chloroploca mongolica]MBP1467941.1 hypothetical protein [Candidatus Chloroploca mongolica]
MRTASLGERHGHMLRVHDLHLGTWERLMRLVTRSAGEGLVVAGKLSGDAM